VALGLLIAFQTAFEKNGIMSTPIQFETTIGDDQVIHIPAGVMLPSGPIRVTVSPCAPTEPPSPEAIARTKAYLLALAKEAEEQNPDLPSDLAANHDFYAHGKPRE
jgi:hypothetical protein